MKCKDYSVKQILVDLHRVGVVDLSEAIRSAEASGLEDREAIVDHMLDGLAVKNYIPDRNAENYRTALWREWLRHCGMDFSAYFSEAPVTVRGRPGAERDRFVELVVLAFATLELRPAISFDSETREGSGPQLEIHGEIIARRAHSQRALEAAIRHSLSDW